MKFELFSLLLVIALFHTGQGVECTTNDPCQLNSRWSTLLGYACIQRGPNNVFCRCPNGEYEVDKPCRLCDRSNVLLNACNNANARFITCLEPNDYGTSYACLCRDSNEQPVATTSWDCDLSVTLTSTSTTTPAAPVIGTIQCSNGGVLVDRVCHCPSGYQGALCEQKNEVDLCNRVTCKNTGVKTIRNPNGPNECVCVCRSGSSGDYCELNGTLGTCATAGCTNGANCRQVTISTTTHAYCECPAGFRGSKCETRYFTCSSTGFFADQEMFEQGKYFECIAFGTSWRAVRRSCPKGLRYNLNFQRCTY